MIALTCFSHCKLCGHSLALLPVLYIYLIMYGELHLCPYTLLLPLISLSSGFSTIVFFLSFIHFSCGLLFLFHCPSSSFPIPVGLLQDPTAAFPLQCYLTIENSDIQSICHCPDKYKGKFFLCNQDASKLKDGFEHRDYSWNNNALVILSGLFLSCGEKLEEQNQVFKQTESPAVNAFASSGGDTCLSKYNMLEDQHLASIWLLKHYVFLKSSKSNGWERERP